TIVIPKHINPDDPLSSIRVLTDEVRYVKKELDNIPSGSAIPLIIYMHGCGGSGGIDDFRTFHFLANKGYAVLAPNSFAREYKPRSCDPETYTGGFHRGVLGFRLAEAQYAHEAVKKMPWVDKQNIFMMGFSEGGITTAKYRHGGLAGRIILGWTCNTTWSEYSGISGPRDVPIFAAVASNDPWFKDPSLSGHYRDYSLFAKRDIESIVIDADCHAIHTLTSVRYKILLFLQINRRF
ncbi:MAG: dienelactone hydrolase family protein, partial [Deltaproteobacteria bacterium]|nr:dienelactone hydrolase family protein [Deltaproteobacteria bacterium]